MEVTGTITGTTMMARRRVLLSMVLLAASWLFLSQSAAAQDQPEYRAEVGGGVGVVNYLGDLNGNLLKNLQPMGSLLGRYKMNPRMAFALNVSFGKLKGSSKNEKSWYPDMQTEQVDFNNTLIDAGLRFEYNFWPYGTGREYRGARPLTPYMALGIGGSFVSGNQSVTTVNLPIAVGVKYKVAERLNLGVEYAMHFSLNDKLDGIKDPYGIKSSGLFKNTDCYGTLQVSLTYDLWAKCKVCHNDRD
jgi:hypothetical protein